MIDPDQFRTEIIKPALKYLGHYSEAAEELLLGTALVESGLVYLRQLGGGPALGVYQMEPAAHEDIWDNYLEQSNKLHLGRDVIGMVGEEFTKLESLVSNLAYATAMTRIHYLRVPEPLPAVGDLEGQARYWKQYYNTHLGKGTVAKYVLTMRKHQ